MSDEEERLSIISSKGPQPIDIAQNNRHSLMSMLPMSRHPSFINASVERNSIGHDSMLRGSFYGRRDFENKHDDTADMVVGSVNTNKLRRKTSTLDNVLTRIKSMRNSDHSESENDDDDDDDDDDENLDL